MSKAPGIGKKTAQKLILELKDKMKLEDAFELKLAHEQEKAVAGLGEISDGRQELWRRWLRWATAVQMHFALCVRLRMCRRMMWKVFLKAALKNFLTEAGFHALVDWIACIVIELL